MKFLLVVIVMGVLVYLAVRALERGSIRPTPGRKPFGGPSTPSRPVAPDDDPDFLREIDRKRRRHPGETDSP